MVEKVLPNSDRSFLPETKGDHDAREAQRALLERPSISIRTRIAAVFLVIFVLLCGITVAAILFIAEFKAKSQFLEKVGNYVFEIQEARRFEKNFFLYGTDLSNALANIHLAHGYLERSAEEIKSVIGRKQFVETKESLTQYENLLERAFQISSGTKPGRDTEVQQIEVELRKHGARILGDAQKMIDEERLSMHSMLYTYTLAAFGFLIFMFFVIAYITGFIIGAVLRPLSRFMNYTTRIGEGNYSPIMPARKYRDEFSNLAIAFNQMLAELAHRQDQLTQSVKMAAVGALTSGIAHELNNPLNNIGITTEALIEDYSEYSDEEKLKMLGQIYTQLERASGTVRNLLDFTRKEQSVFTSVAIQEIVDVTVRLVTNELKLGGVELKLNLESELPEIKGNPRDLQQVFLNLFLNAIQAMPNGGRLSIRAVAGGDGFVRVDVSDTGGGIPHEDLNKIFDPFFTTKDPGQGTGLGLSVTYSTIERHHGKITVESEIGKGTTFSVFLPYAENGESRPSQGG